MMSRIISFFAIFLSLSCLLFAKMSIGADAEDTGSPVIKTPVYSIDDKIKLVSTKKITYPKARVVIRAVYPRLQTNVDEAALKEEDTETELGANERINDDEDLLEEGQTGDVNVDHFNHLVDEMVQETIDQYMDLVAQYKAVQSKIPHTSVRNHLYTDYDASVIKLSGHRIISLRFTIQGTITGMQPRYREHRVLNYNLDNGQIIALEELFRPGTDYLHFLSHYTSARLHQRLANKMMIDTGTEPTLNHFKNWNIKSNGLLITFDENQVGPRIIGAQTVFVPFTKLRNIISSHSPIIDCVKHKSRCMNNNILTGGFIDEAMNEKTTPLIKSRLDQSG